MPLPGLGLDPFNAYRLKAACLRFVLTLFAALGLSLTLAEVGQLLGLLGLPGGRVVLELGVAVGVVVGAWQALRSWTELQTFGVPLNGGGRVTVAVGDLVANVLQHSGASCTFGSNDEFSVRGLRPDSAHAAFLAAFFPTDGEELRQAHLDEARTQADVEVGSGTKAPRLDRCSYGAVVRQPFYVDGEGTARHAFLVANSSRQGDEFHANPEGGALDPVNSVLDYHRRKLLHSETVVFSLVGTGHSHTHNAMQSVFRLIDSYMGWSRQVGASRRPVDHMVISVPERLVVEQGFDLEAVHLYLKARARMESLQGG